MDGLSLSPALTGMGLGLALASAPGPVQAVLFAEAISGGLGGGLRAMFAANLTFGLVLVAVALGLSVTPLSGTPLRVLEVVGGGFLLWLAIDAFRSVRALDEVPRHRQALSGTARSALAVIVNPAVWLFVGVVAAPLFASAARTGGTPSAVTTALALVGGLAIGDATVVVIGGLGVRRAGQRMQRWVRRGLALVLAGLATWLIVNAIVQR